MEPSFLIKSNLALQQTLSPSDKALHKRSFHWAWQQVRFLVFHGGAHQLAACGAQSTGGSLREAPSKPAPPSIAPWEGPRRPRRQLAGVHAGPPSTRIRETSGWPQAPFGRGPEPCRHPGAGLRLGSNGRPIAGARPAPLPRSLAGEVAWAALPSSTLLEWAYWLHGFGR